MILFMKDWARYPNAIADTKTTNESFLRYAYVLKEMGIKNNAWPLALHNPKLQGVDPFSNAISNEAVHAIVTECKFNPWYFFREIARFPASGSPKPMQFKADRGNMAMLWSFFNHIDFFLIMPRQFGKSGSGDQLDLYTSGIAGYGQKIQLYTKDNKLRKDNIGRIKIIRDLLPPYLNQTLKEDADNTEEITFKKFRNKILTAVAQPNEEDADRLGRGMTAAIMRFDEIPYCPWARVSVPAALAAGGAARKQAMANGSFFGNIFTTTAGKLDTPDGAYAYNLCHDGYYWNEIVLDFRDVAQVVKHINDNSKGDRTIINGTFWHNQLGVSDEEMRKIVINAGATEDAANRDFFNVWTSGSLQSPLPTNINNVINGSRTDPKFTQVTHEGYQIRWYYEELSLREKMEENYHIIGLDTSEAIGRDNCSMVISNAKTLGVAAVSSIATTSIPAYGRWIANLLLMYPKTVLVIENKSTGQAILDIVAEILHHNGIDPYRRIYNKVVSEPSSYSDSYKLVDKGECKKDLKLYFKNKNHFGFKTGAASRTHLYGTTLESSASSVGHLLKDNPLISEVLSLVKKNDRVDHPKGGHDDTVIAWLLTQWFMRFSGNLGFYGIMGLDLMSDVAENGSILSEKELSKQRDRMMLRNDINVLKGSLSVTKDPVKRAKLEVELEKLTERTAQDGGEIVTMDSLRTEMQENGKKKKGIRSALNRIQAKRNSYRPRAFYY